MMLTTLQVKISKQNIYGCVRSEGVPDSSEPMETYFDRRGNLKKTKFKKIVNGSYCAIMYLFILQKFNFITLKLSFKGRYLEIIY